MRDAPVSQEPAVSFRVPHGSQEPSAFPPATLRAIRRGSMTDEEAKKVQELADGFRSLIEQFPPEDQGEALIWMGKMPRHGQSRRLPTP